MSAVSTEKKVKVCYFGIYNPDFSRNKIFLAGLKKEGIQVAECREQGGGLRKYAKLFLKLRAAARENDLVIVGYPGHVVVPLAKLACWRPIIFDALGSLYEAERFSYRASPYKRLKAKLIDQIAFYCADTVLAESEPQKVYLKETFGGKADKYHVLHTGADDSVFNTLSPVRKLPDFTVLFRGSLTPEAGLDIILTAAEILNRRHPEENIRFRIMGRGIEEKKVVETIQKEALSNVELWTEYMEWSEFIKKMRECTISLGQFGDNERLERTIPHKSYESLALGLPHITARTRGVSSILTDAKHCLMVEKNDPEDLVRAILELKRDPAKYSFLADEGKRLYAKKFTPQVLARQLLQIITP